MNQNQINVTEAVLASYFSGKANPEERSAVEIWRRSAPSNESQFQEYSFVWERSGNFEPTLQIDMEAAYTRVLQKAGQAAPVLVVRSRYYYLTRIAAVSAILLVSLLLFRNGANKDEFDQSAVATVENQACHLADGTVVWLRNGSKLLYNSSFTRKVRLTGDGYFEVAHNPERPFSVELDGGGTVEVLGTEFHISQTGNNTSVLVKSGKVRFSPTDDDYPVLTASQKAVFSKKDSRMTISGAASMNELSWHTGGLEFVSTPLSKVMEDLEQYYDVKITMENSALNTCLHTAPLTNSSLEEVLRVLELAYGLHSSKTSDNEYILTGGYCGR
ncbi:MAG: FecR family protein [Bacteroidota bacterium]